MEMETLHVACSIDDNYAQHCCVMLCSLFENNKQAKFRIHILTDSLNKKSREDLVKLVGSYGIKCCFYDVDPKKLDGVKFRKHRPLTVAAYYRILLSSLLDESIDKVLYFDSDTLILGDITPIYNIDLTGYALAATNDIATIVDEHRFQLSLSYNKPYFCSGVMLINLDFWRKNESEAKLIAFAKKERHVFFHDQDALNAVFKDNWFMIPPKWNKFYPYIYDNSYFNSSANLLEFEKKPVVIHFFSIYKPWNKISWIGFRWSKYRNLYFKYLDMTPWKGAKPKVLNDLKYGVYKYLILISIHSIKKEILDFYSFKFVKQIENLLLLPVRICFQVPYHLKRIIKK